MTMVLGQTNDALGYIIQSFEFDLSGQRRHRVRDDDRRVRRGVRDRPMHRRPRARDDARSVVRGSAGVDADPVSSRLRPTALVLLRAGAAGGVVLPAQASDARLSATKRHARSTAIGSPATRLSSGLGLERRSRPGSIAIATDARVERVRRFHADRGRRGDLRVASRSPRLRGSDCRASGCAVTLRLEPLSSLTFRRCPAAPEVIRTVEGQSGGRGFRGPNTVSGFGLPGRHATSDMVAPRFP